MQKRKGAIKLWFLSMFFVLGALAGVLPNNIGTINPIFVSADPKVAKPNTDGNNTVNVILITSKKNCSNCSKVIDDFTKVKPSFKTETTNNKLTFAQYDYDKNKKTFESFIKPENLPIILIKKNGDEFTRLSGLKSKEDIEKQIKSALSTTKPVNTPTKPSTDISNLDFTEENNSVKVTADIKNTKIVKTIILIKTTDNKTITKEVKPLKGKLEATIKLSDKKSRLFGPKIAFAQSTKVESVTVEGRDSKDKKIASQSKDASTSSSVADDPTDTTAVGNLSNNPIGLGALYDALRGVSEPLDGAEPDDPKGQLLLRATGLIQFLFALASVVLVLGVIWTGLLYIFSMGNDEQAMKAKKGFINLFYGLALLLVSFTIVSLMRNLIENGKIGL